MESGSLNPRRRLPVGGPTKRELISPTMIFSSSCVYLFTFVYAQYVSPPKKARSKAKKGGRE